MHKGLIVALLLASLAGAQSIINWQQRRGWVAASGYTLPTDSLIINYDITEGSGQTLSDSSGLSNDASLGNDGTTETEDPAWSTAGGEAILDFTHTEGDRFTPPNVSGSFSGAGTLIVALKADAYPGVFSYGGLGQWGSDGALGDVYTHTEGQIFMGALSSARKDAGTSSIDTSAWHILTITSTASDYKIYQNNTQHYSTATNTFGITATPVVGYNVNGHALDGKVAWVLLYSKVLDATERKDAFCYIRQEKPGLGIADNGC